MSTSPDSDSAVQRVGTDQQGRAVLAMPYNESLAKEAVSKGLADQTDTDPDTKTPDPTGEEDTLDQRDGGPVRRFNDVFTDLGSVQLEALGMDGYEIARATSTLRDELFRNDFPVLVPRFQLKCEECGAEYDTQVDACPACTRQYMREEGIEHPPQDLDEIPETYHRGTLRRADPKQKRDAQQLFESVNKEGQSLGDLYRMCEDDQSRLGVSLHVVKWNYVVATGDSNVFDRGEVIHEDLDELVRGDPKRIVPVVDKNGRVGNYWWACPIHRSPDDEHQTIRKEPGRCEHCGARLREVFFVEKRDGSPSTQKPEKYFFENEIVTWAHHFPRLNGLDGLSPVHHVWLKQSILHWMDVYGAAFYDPSSDRYPNKFMVVHTTNPDTWERNFKKAEEDAKENPYSQQIMLNEYATDSQSTPEVQVIDLMNDELLGQDDQIKKRFKSDIRSQWLLSDIHDSELEDAGGLNNEGLQLEVTDRGVASRQHKLMEGPLDELAKLVGLTDWKISFLPPQDEEVQDRLDKVRLGQEAAKGGLDPRWDDGEVEIPDGDFEDPTEGGGMGGLPGLGGGPGGGPPGGGGQGNEGGAGDGKLDGPESDAGPEDVFAALTDDELAELTEKLDDGFEHIVWADETTKADPFWEGDEAVPEFVQDAIETVIETKNAVFDQIESIPVSQRQELEAFFKEKLTQPSGWSLGSISEDLQDRFGLSEEKAETIGATESARILNQTREEAYKAQGDADEKLYKWIGPQDHRTTDACEWLKAQTEDGVTLDRLHELAAEAADEFFPDLDYNDDWVLHPHERHTFVQTKMETAEGEPVAWPTATAPGTFKQVTA